MSSAEDSAELLQTDFQSLPLVEVLQKPPTALLGVSDAAATALGNIGVKTVFDLALSRVFEAAAQLTDAGENASNALNRFGAPASDMLSAPLPPDTRVPDVRFMSPSILAGIPDANAFSTSLGVKTVRDVAFYPPYRAAQQILNQAYFPERDTAFDPEAPADLVPKSGQFPTERAQYTVLLLDEIQRPDNAPPLIDLSSPNFQPIDLSPVTAADFGFRTIGTGALLTLNQSWFMQGVTLGHLLHSMALAPGESTRIAVIDWSRKSRAGQTEEVAETEDLLDDTSHNRSISEVTQAVATEAQSGFSHTQTEAFTQQVGFATGSAMAGMIQAFGSVFGSGGSASEGGTSASADSYASTSGQRNVAASMLQQIGDRTHQHAHAARSRRASVVREVSQSEHEDISTRVVTNYNHMHALTVQYYEVLQLYRTETSVARADRVVFIPFQLVDFTKEDLILRFRRALVRAALNSTIADALTNYDTLELAPDTGVRFPNLGGAIKDVLANPGLLKVTAGGVRTGIMTGPPISGSLARRTTDPTSGGGDATHADTPATVPITTAPVTLPGVSSNAVQRRIATGLWSNQFVRLTSTLGGGIVRGNSPSLFVPSDVKLMDAEVHSSSGQSLASVFYRRDGTQLPDLQGTPVALSEIARVAIRGSNASADVDASVALTLIRNSVVFPLELPAVTIPRGTAETRVVQINAGGGDVNLKQHLMDNDLYYSRAVFRTLDAAQIAGLLSGFSMNLNGQVLSVAQVVDPIPIRVVGNFLAFKISADPTADAEWKRFLDRRGIAIGQAKVEFVPLSSGGVFAEAVLGRFNSAEKLDITRFWNWQDSPIPIQPSDIAPITAASRAQPEAIAPGQLSAPIVSIQQPTALPDPSASFAATIAAIQNGNMFRDMSGISEVVKLAQSAIQASSAGATAAGAQASSNYQTAVEGAVEVYKANLLGGGKKNSAADKNPSTQGALINEQDKRRGGTVGGGTTGGGAVSGSSGSSGGSAPAGESSSSGNPALDVATFGPEGKPFDETVRNALGLDAQSLTSASGAASPGGGGTAITVPPYGGYDLKFDQQTTRTDSDTAKRWGGTVRAAPAPLPAAGQLGFVSQLKTDLRALGFKLVDNVNGVFDLRTFWAVREFQIYASQALIAQEVAAGGGPARYVDRLSQTANPQPYTGPISGVVKADTRDLLQLWLSNRFRCPVVVDALLSDVTGNFTIVRAENIWDRRDYPHTDARMFARDFSEQYAPFPTGHRLDEEIVLGDFAIFGGQSGPSSEHSWAHWATAEMTAQTLAGAPAGAALNTLDPGVQSCFRVIRAVAEVECEGFFDEINAYDDVFISQGPFHNPIGEANETLGGELGGVLAEFFANDPVGYEDAFGRFGILPKKAWGANGLDLIHSIASRRFVTTLQLSNQASGFDDIDLSSASLNMLRSWHWFYRFEMAGRTKDDYRQAIWRASRARLRAMILTSFGHGVANVPDATGTGNRPATIWDLYTSERALALILRWHVRFPAHMISGFIAGAHLNAAFTRARVGGAAPPWGPPSTWADVHEQALIDALMAEVGTLGNPGLLQTMTTVLNFAGLDNSRGSFHLDATDLGPTV